MIVFRCCVRSVSFFVWLSVLTFANPQIAVAQTVSDITDLILVTGQSNVRGSLTDYDPVLDSSHPRIFAFTTIKQLNAYSAGGTWQRADLHQAWDVDGWHPGNGSLSDASRQPYNHFAFHFAKSLVESDSTKIVGLVIVAAPGEGIQHWDVGGDFGGTKYPDGVTFDEVVNTQAIEALTAQGVKTSFDAVLWHQGETDWQEVGTSDINVLDHYADDPDYDPAKDANYYPSKLSALIARYRNSSWFSPNKPFICGETKQAAVNKHLRALNDDSDPWTGCVVATDLSTRDANGSNPGSHFDANGLRLLGRRYATRYLQLTDPEALNCNGFTATVNTVVGDMPTEGADVIIGTLGRDVIVARAGDDTICAGGGDDVVNAGGGDDWIDGGAGSDDLSGSAGDDMIFGGLGSDIIRGGVGNDDIEGEDGDDTLLGQGDDDLLDGGSGIDDIKGGSGNDTIYTGAGATVGSGVFVSGGGGNDTIYGGPEADDLRGTAGLDTINGEGGNDVITGGNARDMIDGGDGNDLISGQGSPDEIDGGSGADTINGGDGNDVVNGGAGADTINGGAGNDNLMGDAGSDIVRGGPDNDDLSGGSSAGDVCDGQSGTDTVDATCETIVGVP